VQSNMTEPIELVTIIYYEYRTNCKGKRQKLNQLYYYKPSIYYRFETNWQICLPTLANICFQTSPKIERFDQCNKLISGN
jgi:hypothetical protein